MDRPRFLCDLLEPRAWWQKTLPYALLFGVTIVLYGAALRYGFVWDDGPYVETNYRIQRFTLANLRAIWSAPYLGHYAPLHHTLLALIHLFSGLNPLGYHLANLLIHSANLCLLYQVLKKMESTGVALLSCVLLAIHPTTIETVAWIAESKSTLALFFFLLSWKYYLRSRSSDRTRDLIVCGIFLTLSVLSKINTVVTPVAFLMYEYRERAEISRRKLLSLAFFFLISLTMIIVHLTVFYGPTSNFPEPTYYPGGLPVHLLNLPTLIFFYLRILFVPYPLSGWHVIAISSNLNWVLLAKSVVIISAAAVMFCLGRPAQFWGGWFILFLLPVLQIVPFPIWVAERYLYIPAIGIFVLLGRALEWAWKNWSYSLPRLALQTGVALALMVLGWITWNHIPVWKSDLTFWDATEQTCSTAAYCHVSLGNALLRAGQTTRGMQELIAAVNLRPNLTNLSALGDAYVNIKDFRQANIAYQAAWKQSKDPPGDLYARLGRAYLFAGDLDQAEQIIEAGLRVDPKCPNLLMADGFLQWKLGNLEPSRRAVLAAFDADGVPPDSARYILQFWGNQSEVEKLLDQVFKESRSPLGSLSGSPS